jgi:beta-glucosidase/6-phospho-beta-glucosidase/beta-galactosidase
MFPSFFIGGFECSTHRLCSGRRLDMIAATRHDRFAEADYARCREQGIATVREGIRWHLIERLPGRYDFSSVLPMLHAAQAQRMRVIWDLCHYGWPDDIDIFRPEFVRRFAGLARAFTRLLTSETLEPPLIAPINEISFLAWQGAEVGSVYPCVENRGFELKCQLVRATIAASEAIREVAPNARLLQIEPIFNVVADSGRPEDADAAEGYRQLQFQGWDMLSGRIWPQLGGAEKYLDVIGVNYYPWNQWLYAGPKHGGATIDPHHPGYRRLRDMLQETYHRYRRPLFIAETGREGEQRPRWLRHIGSEARAALANGVPLQGICLYPIVNFPGWENERHCENGLWDYADENGERPIYEPLARELNVQRPLCERAYQRFLRGGVEMEIGAA